MSEPALPEKIETIYREQGRELWALFYAHCCDAESAYDALQESFLRLAEQNGTPIRDVRAWLLQVGRNWLRDVARRRRVAAKNCDHLDSLADVQEEPGTMFRREELHGRVREALAELRPSDREVLVLRYSMDWSSNRMARALQASPSAIDMRLSRARRRLAEILKKLGIEDEF